MILFHTNNNIKNSYNNTKIQLPFAIICFIEMSSGAASNLH